MLHITNGDLAAGGLREAGFEPPFVPWRDVLHDGPVRSGLTLEQLSNERAAFIAEAFQLPPAEVQTSFAERNALLRAAPKHDEVVLWFEHDLYDQLQLLQLLDWFSENPHPRLSLVCEPEYLGSMSPERMQELFPGRAMVGATHAQQGSAAWRAFTSSDPTRLQCCETACFRFLAPALKRHLEEFPWIGDGLSRLERAIKDALDSGSLRFADLFLAIREEPNYLGDFSLAWHLERMRTEGLLESEGDLWSRKVWTSTRRQRLRRLPRWLGGVLVDEHCRWRWDPAAERLVELP